MVVNSHHAMRRALCERIRASLTGFSLWEAATMDDALALLDQIDFDVVVIDGEGGGIGGLKGTRAILERSPRASVIVMSAFSDSACRSAASQAGAMAFVSKRALGSELVQVLAELAGRKTARKRKVRGDAKDPATAQRSADADLTP
jgi:DNA-binding NarL/FixJ family response regulator